MGSRLAAGTNLDSPILLVCVGSVAVRRWQRLATTRGERGEWVK